MKSLKFWKVSEVTEASFGAVRVGNPARLSMSAAFAPVAAALRIATWSSELLSGSGAPETQSPGPQPGG